MIRRSGARAFLGACLLAAPVVVAGDWPEIQGRGVLRVLAPLDSMPEMFSLKGEPAPGIERELIEGFAALHKLRIAYVPVASTHERIPGLLEDKADVLVGGMAITEARRKLVDFTTEVLPLRHVVVTRRPHPLVASLEQLRHERVATLKGSSWAEQVEAAGVPRENVETLTTVPEIMASLRSGRASAVVLSTPWAIVEQRKDGLIELGLFVGPALGQAWAVRKQTPQLRQALDDYLGNVRRTATWSRLVTKYYGESALEILRKSRGSL
jgi:peptidoglycan lytic transglycosylase F